MNQNANTIANYDETTGVNAAARWLASQKRQPASITPNLRTRFSLTAEEAEQAIREARLIHARAM
jgi:predicted metal-dependent hydrolase